VRVRFASLLALALVAVSAGSLLARQQPALKRTVLQQRPLSVPGREGIHALAELAPGGVAARHTHPGEELGYVIEGTAILEITGQPAQVLKPGDVFFIPANTAHTAKNNGTVPWKIIGTYFIEAGKPLATPAP
jgi:quercetin dioxygenase-like cupin family protein